MPNLFARRTYLSDVAGRIDYISNPLRQEHCLATYDTASDLLGGQYWQILAKESQAAFEQFSAKTRTVKSKSGDLIEQELQCKEAQELFFLLGNELLDRMTPDQILKTACDKISQKIGRPVTGALHLNKAMKSLHLHVIFADRELLQEPVVKVAERNLFFNAEGKRVYKKGEILDADKQLLPGCRIVKKGEIYESRCFGSVDERMLDQEWLKDLKTNCILALRNGELKGNVEITEYDPSTGKLPQQYIGNRADEEIAGRIAEYNALVREYNDAVDAGVISHDDAMMIQKTLLGSKNKNRDITWYINQIRKFLQEEREQEERARRSLDNLMGDAGRRSAAGTYGRYWQVYSATRDSTWEAFIQGQRAEFKAIRGCRADRQALFLKNSHMAYDRHGCEVGLRLNSRTSLEKAGYFERRDEIDGQIKKHQANLGALRKYQEVAKGRQRIVRALLIAGAEKDVVDAAMRNYQEAMGLLQSYAINPESDYEHRRLKAAQWSLGQAQARADRYIKQLEEEKLREETPLEQVADQEYQAFKAGMDPVAADGDVAVSTQPRQAEASHAAGNTERAR